MAAVVPIKPDKELCAVTLVRRATGELGMRLDHMPTDVIESEAVDAEPGEEAADRMLSIAIWLEQAAVDARRQYRALLPRHVAK